MSSILICLTKHNNSYNFYEWLQYHKNLGFDKIYIFNNNSIVDIEFICKKLKVNYINYPLAWPNQNKLYNQIFSNKTSIQLTNKDFVICLDDDEYLWIDKSFNNINEVFNWYIDKYNCEMIYLPWNFMSSPEVLKTLPLSWITHLSFRRKENLFEGIQGKAIIQFNTLNYYDWNFYYHNKNLGGHAPFINDKRISINSIGEIVEGLYSLPDTLYDNSTSAKLRLFHYHIKSLEDWSWKIQRGSAANNQQIYDDNIENNRFYGKYEIKDSSMIEAKKRFLYD